MADTGKSLDSTIRVFSDIILLILIVAVYLLHGGLKPFERGFFCDDQDIKHPYKPDTVSWNLLLPLGICVPCFMMIFTELPHYLRRKTNGEASHVSFCGINVGMYAVQLYKAMVPFVIAVFLNLAVMEIFKLSVGRLRPYFLTVCRPNMSVETCMEDGYYKYVTDYSCVASDIDFVNARKSFPSGHTGHSFICAVYLMMYLHSRMTWRWGSLPRHVLQVAALCLACYVAASRVSDYKHHPTDVLGGAVLGTLIAVIVRYFFYGSDDLFQQRKLTTNDPNIPLSEYDRIE